jgi:replicative DNA helicase
VETINENETLTHIGELIVDTYSTIEKHYNNRDDITGLSSGFYDLDSITAGFQPCDLIVVASRPSMGKTAFCINIAQEVALKNKKSVVIFCSEMSQEQLTQRLLCSEAEIDSNRLRTGYMHADDWTKLDRAMNDIGGSSINVDDSFNMSPNYIKEKINIFKENGNKPDLVIIDPLQLMRSENKSNINNHYDRTIEISEIMRELKAIAMEFKIPVIITSQVGRSTEARQNKKPMLCDLSESDSILQIADIVMFIYRDEYYNPDNLDNKGKAEIIVSKHRNGPVGSIDLLFQGNILRFKNNISQKSNVF